ncbi:hypothetical protein CSA80_02765 [Candidatus Saccharibacteria bacterium]|nr:MAG: hypothetical protein CR973_02880 [Candidatus Saccharibacteria bacterium]PID99013.1 MAG: hypothetical protein CSA80_02765 [Candidatus Saccharibacteria bacterium]
MKHFRRVFSGSSAMLLAFSSLLTLGVTGVASAAGQTCTWTGGGGDNKFSTAANWTDCGGGAPLADDVIRFAQQPTATTALENDLGVDLAGLVAVAEDSASTGAWYTVDRLDFAASAAVTIERANTCTPAIVKVVPTEVNGAGDLSIQAGPLGYTEYKATVAGDLTITGSGRAFKSFTAGSTANNVIIASPLGTAGYTTATCQDNSGGAGTMRVGAVSNDLSGLSYASVTVENGASISLADYAKPMTLGGGTGSEKPTVFFDPDTDPNTYEALDSNRTWSSAVTLASDAYVAVGSKTNVNFTGTLAGAGKTLGKTATSTGTFTNNATANSSATPSGQQTNPVKTTTITDKTSEHISVVPNETTVLDGERAGVTVLAGGKLKGTGTVTGSLLVLEGGSIAPGHSPGCVTTDTLTLSGEYEFELGGTDPCSGYDQIRVTSATADPSVNFSTTPTATILTSRFNGYTPQQGQSFTIIDNTGPNAIFGTFKDLPEGATFEQNGIVFRISYVGGTGNDVVLTVQNQPTAPDTGFALLTTNPLLTIGVAAAAALLLVGLARRSRLAPARAQTRKRT